MFALVPFLLALSYNRLVLASLKHVNIGRNHSGAIVLDACRKRVKVAFRGRSNSLDDFEFVASFLCVTGRHFDSARSLSLWRGAHFENAKRTLCPIDRISQKTVYSTNLRIRSISCLPTRLLFDY